MLGYNTCLGAMRAFRNGFSLEIHDLEWYDSVAVRFNIGKVLILVFKETLYCS